MKERILVIGGAGFIGSNLVRYLVENSIEVTVFHRPGSDLRNLNNVHFNSVTGDFIDKKNIEQRLSDAMEGCSAVYNLAGFYSTLKKHYRLMEIINKEAPDIVACVAKKVGIARLIHVSSSAAVGYPENGEIADENFSFNANCDYYALTKHEGEQAVLRQIKNGLDAVIAIPCSTLGARGMKPEQHLVFRKIIGGKMRICPPGGLCLTDVGDLIRGLHLCCTMAKAGKRYILGGCNIKYKDYFGEIARAAGARPPSIVLPRLLMPWLGLGAELASGLLKKETGINKNIAILTSRNLYYSSGLALRELGYTITDWKETVRNTAKEF